MEGQTPLTAEEADIIRDDLIFGLEQLERGFDELISKTNKARAEAVIWSSIDYEDNKFLAQGLINIGMKDPAAAWAVRGIAHSADLLRTGVILLPRFIETVRFYGEHGGLALPL